VGTAEIGSGGSPGTATAGGAGGAGGFGQDGSGGAGSAGAFPNAPGGAGGASGVDSIGDTGGSGGGAGYGSGGGGGGGGGGASGDASGFDISDAGGGGGGGGSSFVSGTTPTVTDGVNAGDWSVVFTYTAQNPAPAVTSVSPSSGLPSGGTTVTITGTNLAGATAITFGANPATGISCTATSCTAAAPAGNPGTVGVQVTTPAGTSPATSAGQYTYATVPATLTWATPAAITYGTPLSHTQLDATASVAGTFTYSPPSGTVLQPGTQTLTATFTPADTTDYTGGAVTTHLSVGFTQPCIATAQAGHRTIGAGQSLCISAGGSIAGPVNITTGGALWVSGGKITGPVSAASAAALTLCASAITGPPPSPAAPDPC
jgi:hypothetical protein